MTLHLLQYAKEIIAEEHPQILADPFKDHVPTCRTASCLPD
jgi:hypothetical protein